MAFKPIVGKFVDVAGFRDHVDALVFTGWQPSFVVVHNTSEPDLATYAEWRAHPEKHGHWTPEQWGRNLASYYAGLGWSTGPHAFVTPDGILLFTPFTMPGTHSPSWNSRTWGIETVGEFEREPFAGSSSEANLIAVLGILHARLGLDPANYQFGVRGLHFHKEDPNTTHKECPGKNMAKPHLVAAVTDYIAQLHPGDHHDVPLAAHTVPAGHMLNITATVFGGHADRNTSAYDGHVINDTELGVALPARLTQTPRPKVRVFHGAQSVLCDVVDVGPWNINDPYWQTGARPQAESGRDMRGRPTNHAGIDLTPAAARAIGINGKGTVDWAFADATGAVIPSADTPSGVTPPPLDPWQQLILWLVQQHMANAPTSMPAPAAPTATQPDLAALIQQLLALVQMLHPPAGQAGAAQQDPINQVIKLLTALSGGQPPLGPVNGALGQTLGNLLDGKKSAIGIIGALITALLQASGLSSIIPTLGAAGLGKFAMPIFLAIAAWGVLGKLEKWMQSSSSILPPKP